MEGGIIRACGLGFLSTALTIVMFLVFSVYTATGGELSPRRVFITLSLVIVLRLVAVQWGVHNILNSFEGWVALVRLQVSSYSVYTAHLSHVYSYSYDDTCNQARMQLLHFTLSFASLKIFL